MYVGIYIGYITMPVQVGFKLGTYHYVGIDAQLDLFVILDT